MLNHFRESLPAFETNIGRNLDAQCLNEGCEGYGAAPNFAKGFNEPAEGIGLASSFIVAYYNPYTKWYHNPELLRRAKIAAAYTLAHTNSDGSIDLMETNFHDSTSNAFAVQGVAPTYLLLDRFSEHTEAENEVGEMYLEFLRRSAKAMVNLGFHTPNHRWVVSSALSYCYNILGDESCLIHLKKFLAEGIDCDENGEYTERSSGGYNIICNRSLMILAQQLNMPELYEHVTRNLYMVMKYFEPDRTVNTMNSTRQDFGTDASIEAYYPNLLSMALATGNSDFAGLADDMLRAMLGRFANDPTKGGGCDLIPFLMDPTLEEKMLATKTSRPLTEYEKFFEASGIMRMRQGNTTLTLVKERPLFCKLQHNNKRMYLRFAGSFFGPLAQFVPQTLVPEENGYRLTYHQRWGYKRPFEVAPETSDWRKMDHTKRESVGMRDFDVTFHIRLENERLDVTVDAGGCENIPCKLELMFDAGGCWATDNTELVTREGDYIFLKHGKGEYTFNDHDKFVVDGGFYTHRYAKSMRGAIPGDAKAFTVAMTCLTDETRTVSIKIGNDQTI